MTPRLSAAFRPVIRQLGVRRFHACVPVHNPEPTRVGESSTQTTQRPTVTDADTDAEARAKAKVWYLEQEDDDAPSTISSTGPVFTTYNPLTTLPTPALDIPLQPLPQDAPDFIKPLYTFLTSNELFVPHSISVHKTHGSRASKSVAEFPPNGQQERGKRRRSKSDSGAEGIVIQGHETGAYWDWIVVVQVAARGKGAVGRGERSIREWLHYNPLNAPPRPRPQNPDSSKRLNLPRSDPDTDWTVLDPGRGVGINVMTAEGREKWGLEDAWKASK